jgi:hypothetical protein
MKVPQNYYYIEVTNPPTQVNFGVVELVLVAFNIEGKFVIFLNLKNIKINS